MKTALLLAVLIGSFCGGLGCSSETAQPTIEGAAPPVQDSGMKGKGGPQGGSRLPAAKKTP
jgi:hypothetical protein